MILLKARSGLFVVLTVLLVGQLRGSDSKIRECEKAQGFFIPYLYNRTALSSGARAPGYDHRCSYSLFVPGDGGLLRVFRSYLLPKMELNEYYRKLIISNHEEIVQDMQSQCGISKEYDTLGDDCFNGENYQEIMPGITITTLEWVKGLLRHNMTVVPCKDPLVNLGKKHSALYAGGGYQSDTWGEALKGLCEHVYKVGGENPSESFEAMLSKTIENSIMRGLCVQDCKTLLKAYKRHKKAIQKLIDGKGKLMPLFFPKDTSIEACIKYLQAGQAS